MNTINARIKLVIDRLAGGNNSKFAAMVGTSETNIRNYTLEVQPKANFLLILITKFKVNVEWLLVGGPESEMFLKDEIKGVENNTAYQPVNVGGIDVVSELIESYKSKLIDKERIIESKIELIEEKNRVIKLLTEKSEVDTLGESNENTTRLNRKYITPNVKGFRGFNKAQFEVIYKKMLASGELSENK